MTIKSDLGGIRKVYSNTRTSGRLYMLEHSQTLLLRNIYLYYGNISLMTGTKATHEYLVNKRDTALFLVFFIHKIIVLTI